MIINNNLFSYVGKYNFKNISFSNPINFKGVEKDTFELSQQVDCEYNEDLKKATRALKRKLASLNEEYSQINREDVFDLKAAKLKSEIDRAQRNLEVIKKCPELAFLFDPDKTKEQKIKEFKKNKDRYIDLNDEEFSSFSKKLKSKLVYSMLDYVTFAERRVIAKTQKNKIILETLKNKKVLLESELDEIYGINAGSIDAQVLKIKDENGVEQRYKGVYDVNSAMHQKILDDILSKKVAADSVVKKGNVRLKDFDFVKKTYQTDKGETFVSPDLVDLENETNLKIINAGCAFLEILSESRLVCDAIYTDLSNKTIQELIRNANLLTPQKSPYNICASKENAQTVDISIEHLVSLGFGEKAELLKMVQNGTLKGKTEVIDGVENAFVTLKRDEFFDTNNELKILVENRDKNPKIKSARAFAKSLGIPMRQINRSIFYGEIEIIPYFITMKDKHEVFIDISTEKNRNYARKIKFEKELAKASALEEKEKAQKAKIENQDLRQRIQGLRMSLVWEFMPKTKEVASNLASQDGYLCQLLIKEQKQEEKLTIKEEVKLNSYRLKLWKLAGIEELSEAHKKANAIIKAYKEQGIEAIGEEFLPIFEKYGFQ